VTPETISEGAIIMTNQTGRDDQQDAGEYTDVEEPDGQERPNRTVEQPGQYTDVDRDEEV
jgi:hypothetical protein